MWDLLAVGRRADRRHKAIVDAIAPIWEANHVWLILVIVLLFTGFPKAFAVIMIALHIPMTVMLVGIVLRGAAFVFRKYEKAEQVRHRWGKIFGISSVFTPLFQGLTLGALATGAIRASNGTVTSGFFAGWLTPFAIACGVFALALFSFLAATYLTLDTRHDPELQDAFRIRALCAELFLIGMAVIVFLTSKHGAPAMYAGLTNWWAPLLLTWTGLSALAALVSLWRRWFKVARVAAIMQVSLF